MYASSRNGGTHPLRNINTKEFHERQWSGTTNHIGKLIGEKSRDLIDLLSHSEPDQPAQDAKEGGRTAKLSENIQTHRGLRVHDWETPNANFARKFGLYTGSGPLPPSIRELPVAEDKVINAGHYSDPSPSTLTPLRTDFVVGSPSLRARSLSPRKRLARQPLHIRMNLTEGQMDRITDAFSQKVQSSPARTRSRAAALTPRSSPRRRNRSQNETQYFWRPNQENNVRIDSPSFSELMPGREATSMTNDLSSGSLVERRCRAPLPPLQVGGSQHQPNEPRRPQMEAVTVSVSPLSDVAPNLNHFEGFRVSFDDPTSVYSQDVEIQYSARPEPLDVRAFSHRRSRSNLNDAVVDAYKDWALVRTPSPPKESAPRPESRDRRPRRSKSTGEALRQQCDVDLDLPPMTPRNALRSENATPFSPLQMYFRGPDFPSVKKGEKTMIGNNGWLERTDQAPEKKKTPQRKGGIIEGIKKIAKDMAELHHSARRPQNPTRERPSLQVIISLDAREQSLLYCELEFHLSSALNDYITVQLDKGRLNPDKLKRVADGWQQKGRPKVVGFRYDLETQLQLVNLHINDFRFYGRRQGDPIEIGGLLHAMRVNARAMSVRTFCHPDSVIAKQLVDSQSLFKLLGVPDAQQISLAEIAQFFKVIIEREADYRAKRQRHSERAVVMTRRERLLSVFISDNKVSKGMFAGLLSRSLSV
ncbi:hypothetical protein B0T10DRAFT_584400 [Thelonectria olida]|uniref:Uncharacterized protein n=1 Tax=Thelonectria olida TaxID=1576542 RepID=A0A9P9AJL2_9HYPO|nr:hypothetical protein B0T10DRAFT_584400 [Thelonectria olida]